MSFFKIIEACNIEQWHFLRRFHVLVILIYTYSIVATLTVATTAIAAIATIASLRILLSWHAVIILNWNRNWNQLWSWLVLPIRISSIKDVTKAIEHVI